MRARAIAHFQMFIATAIARQGLEHTGHLRELRRDMYTCTAHLPDRGRTTMSLPTSTGATVDVQRLHESAHPAMSRSWLAVAALSKGRLPASAFKHGGEGCTARRLRQRCGVTAQPHTVGLPRMAKPTMPAQQRLSPPLRTGAAIGTRLHLASSSFAALPAHELSCPCTWSSRSRTRRRR
jgi:hypothetical protein